MASLLAEYEKMIGGILVLFIAFRVLDRLRPKDRRMRLLRRGVATDVSYLAITPLMNKLVEWLVLLVVVLPFALLIYGTLEEGLVMNGFGPLSRLPTWLQAFLMLILGDFIGYWMHRWFHRGRMWRFHAVHHSSVDLDWLSSVRMHPVNDLLHKVATTAPLLLLGFAPVSLAAVLPVLALFGVLAHANLDWDWGPLRTVIVSPRFHRWHHTTEAEALDTNFAGLFPLWDLLFGTYHMPANRRPSRFGTSEPVPPTLGGQLLHPFRNTGALPGSREGGDHQSASIRTSVAPLTFGPPRSEPRHQTSEAKATLETLSC